MTKVKVQFYTKYWDYREKIANNKLKFNLDSDLSVYSWEKLKSSPQIWKGVSATSQSDRCTLSYLSYTPVHTRRWPNAGLMLYNRYSLMGRRRGNIFISYSGAKKNTTDLR